MQVFINNNATFCYKSKEKKIILKHFLKNAYMNKKDKKEIKLS